MNPEGFVWFDDTVGGIDPVEPYGMDDLSISIMDATVVGPAEASGPALLPLDVPVTDGVTVRPWPSPRPRAAPVRSGGC